MIISGGYNIYPREVEEALLAHPAVTGAAVVGAPDDTWVEAVTAFVTLRPGAGASEDELRQAVRTRLAGYKGPKTVQVIDAIPMSPVGKVLRRALRDRCGTGRTSNRVVVVFVIDGSCPARPARPSAGELRNVVGFAGFA
jgi:acyl-CoA synthetase (AMP-forming)/AMP-acid ligase II